MNDKAWEKYARKLDELTKRLDSDPRLKKIRKSRERLEQKLQKPSIPFLTGRPERSKRVNGDDVANLKIALNTAPSLDEFLSMV